MQNFSFTTENPVTRKSIDFIQIFANDKRMILYRPEWRKFTGSVLATILLQQIIFRWDQNGRQPFYKFKEPCEHSLYRTGDSWTEELGFSRKEFDNAISKIGFKKSARKNHVHDMPVEYWIDPSRITYYTNSLLKCYISSMSIPEVSATPGVSEYMQRMQFNMELL